jgi:hypothetical protein
MLFVLLVTQLAVVTPAERIPPAKALAILARLDSPSNWTNRFHCSDCDGPRVTIVPYHPGDGPFGPFPVYYLPPHYFTSYGGSYYAPYYTSTYPYGRRAFAQRGPGRMMTNKAPRPTTMSRPPVRR